MSSRQPLATRDLALIAIFTGIMAALSLLPAIYAFGGAVPITAQTLGVMLAGAVLGAKRGALSVLLYLGLAFIGLPILAGGGGGLAPFVGPTAGYLVAFPIAAWLIGRLTEMIGRPYRLLPGIMANIVGGVIVVSAIGIVGLAVLADLGLAKATTTATVFIPGDLAKAVIAAVIAKGVHTAYPGLIPRRAARTRVGETSPV